MAEPTPGPRGVFVSYASQDLEIAAKVVRALESAGIEVWFDHSELRGGDAWDQGIRRQIRECRLFLPIITATTERRREGYFRLEWRLADQRTHQMGRGLPFIVPVCVGDIVEDDADVPDSFLAVHWTRLPGGTATPEFVEHVKSLLAAGDDESDHRAESRPPYGNRPGRRRLSHPWLVAGLALLALVALGFAVWPRLQSGAGTENPIGNAVVFENFTNVRDAFTRDRTSRARLAEQERQLRAIVEAEPGFASAWSLLALVYSHQVANNFDVSEARRALAKEAVDKAVVLAPKSSDKLPYDTLRGRGVYLAEVVRDYPAAEADFKEFSVLRPNDGDGPGYLGTMQRHQGKWKDALANLRLAVDVDSGNLAHARTLEGLYAGARLPFAANQRSEIIRVLPGRLDEEYELAALNFRSFGQTRTGEMFFGKLTPEQSESPLGLSLRTSWARLTGNYDEAIKLDDLQPHYDGDGAPVWEQAIDSAVTMAANGNAPAARARLANVLSELQDALDEQPGNPELLQALGQVYAIRGNREEALANAIKGRDAVAPGTDAVLEPLLRYRVAAIQNWLGDSDAALTELGQLLKTVYCPVTIHSLKFDPWWYSVRADPRFLALLADQANNAPLVQDDGGRGARGLGGGRGAPGGGGGGFGGPPGGNRGQRPGFPPTGR